MRSFGTCRKKKFIWAWSKVENIIILKRDFCVKGSLQPCDKSLLKSVWRSDGVSFMWTAAIRGNNIYGSWFEDCPTSIRQWGIPLEHVQPLNSIGTSHFRMCLKTYMYVLGLVELRHSWCLKSGNRATQVDVVWDALSLDSLKSHRSLV